MHANLEEDYGELLREWLKDEDCMADKLHEDETVKKARKEEDMEDLINISEQNSGMEEREVKCAENGSAEKAKVSSPELSIEIPKMCDLPGTSSAWINVELPVDILLLTVEDFEFLSCFAFLKEPFKSYHSSTGHVYFGCMGDDQGKKIKIALMRCSKGPDVPGGSLSVSKDAILLLRPKAIISVGACSGLNSREVKSGDVVVSAKLITAEHKTPPSRDIGNLIRHVADGWKAPLQNADEYLAKVHCDGVFLSISEANKDMIGQHPEAIAVEMEGGGVFAAAHDFKTEWVVFKGIKDFANERQSSSEKWKQIACVMAASVVANILSDPVIFQDWPHYNAGANELPVQGLPEKPTITNVESEVDKDLTVTWSEVEANSSNCSIKYRLEWTKQPMTQSTELVQRGNIVETHYEITGLEYDAEYEVKLFAVNKQGDSEPDVRTFKTKSGSIPAYVLARGPVGLEAYRRALETGKTYDRRIKIMLIGQDRSGKTSLRRYLGGETFNEQEPSTDGIVMIPSIKNAGTGAWKNPADLETTSAFHHKFAEVVTQFTEETQETLSDLLTRETSESIESNNPRHLENISKEDIQSNTGQNSRHIEDTSKKDIQRNTGTQDVKKEQKLEEIPDEVLFLVERGLEGTKKIWPMVWDFAGQAVYHAIHPIFLLQEDLYVLVSDLTQELCTPAQCRVRTHNDEKVVESPHDEDTNLDHMMRWLDLVHSLSSPKVKKKSESLRGNLPSDAPLASLPPVVLVGTHADGVTNPREKMDFVFKTICNKASRATVEHISKESFFIDNSNPNRDNDRQIVSLRKELLDLCERMPHINNEIPLQWLRVEEKIHQMVTDRQVRYVCKKSFKEDIAEGICQINNTDDVEELLHFLQARGSVIYQDHPEKPDGLVVLDPEWLIRVLSMIITVSPPWKNDPSIQKDYEFLKRRGLLSQQLLNRAFKHLELEGIRDSLIHIMEKFLVICDSKNCNGKEYPYFVPFMLRSPIKDTRGPKVQNGPLPVFLKFNTKYIPSGLFCRLGVLFWHWASKFYPHCKAPAFYANAARFQVSEDYHLILKCHRTVIKLAIWTRRDSDAEKEQSLCEELLSHLEHCKSELSITCRWLQSVTWELHVQCSLCEPCPKKSRVGTDICIWHGQEGCRHDDCGHYLKLRSLGLSASCKYCVDDVPHLSAEKLEPWTQALVSFKCKEKNGKRKRKMSPECSNKRPNQPEGKKRRQMLPGCSGKRLKQPKVKKGKPKEDELEELGYEIGEDWMVLGRRLGVTKPEIQNLKQQPDKLAERAYQMLLKWKQTKGCDATYQALNDALLHRFVQRKDLAERICLNKV